MATKINQIQQMVHPDALLLSSWLEEQGLGRAEQTRCVRNGWLTRVFYRSIFISHRQSDTLYLVFFQLLPLSHTSMVRVSEEKFTPNFTISRPSMRYGTAYCFASICSNATPGVESSFTSII